MSKPSAHRFSFKAPDGDSIDLSAFKGQPVLVVNTASHCGLTPQYAALEELYQMYKDKGLVVLAVPSADFGGQEFETDEEVSNFTKDTFSITMPVATITNVSGSDSHPFYQWAGKEAGFLGRPKWNFHKYLLDGEGQLAAWFASTTSPTSQKIKQAIESEL